MLHKHRHKAQISLKLNRLSVLKKQNETKSVDRRNLFIFVMRWWMNTFHVVDVLHHQHTHIKMNIGEDKWFSSTDQLMNKQNVVVNAMCK